MSAATRRQLCLILGTACVLRLTLALTIDPGAVIADERHYITLAHSLVGGTGYSFPSGPTSLRPPLYPAFIAALWLGTGSTSLVVVRVAQVVVAMMTTLVVFGIGRTTFGDRAGLLTAAIMGWYPAFVFADLLLLSEPLFALLVAGCVAAALATVRRDRWELAAITGVLLGLAALTRSVLYPFPLVLGALVAWWTPGSPARRLLFGLLLLSGFAATVGPWSVRNTRLQGVPVIVDTMGGMNLRMGNYEYTPHDRAWDAVSQTGDRSWIVGLPPQPPGGGEWTEGQKERWARGRALDFMRAHPGLTAWRGVIKLGDFWALDRDFLAGVQRGMFHPPVWVTVLGGSALVLAYPLVIGLAVLGVWLVRPVDARGAWLLLAVVAFVCALHTVVFAHPRYRLPMMPLLIVFSGAAAAANAWRDLDVRTWRGRGALMTLTAFFGLWLLQIAWRDLPAVRTLVPGAGS